MYNNNPRLQVNNLVPSNYRRESSKY